MTAILGSSITRNSVRSTSATGSSGMIRQFTVARAVCGSAFSAWPASRRGATQGVGRGLVHRGEGLRVAASVEQAADRRSDVAVLGRRGLLEIGARHRIEPHRKIIFCEPAEALGEPIARIVPARKRAGPP